MGETVPLVRFVWTVKKEADAGWGFEQVRSQVEGDLPEDFEVYVTGKGGGLESGKGNSIELQEREDLLGEGVVDGIDKDHVRSGRPDLRSIVDETFSYNGRERVAILVCGPVGMGAAVRKAVGRWVWKGRDAFWHSEDFGW